MPLSDTATHPALANADPLQALRDATHTAHSLLDSTLGIAQPTASLKDYADHIQGLAAWLQALRPQLANLGDTVRDFDFLPNARIANLEADLQDMPPLAGAMVATPWPLPSVATAECLNLAVRSNPGHHNAIAWGVGYVVEGSQLGGQVLYRRLQAPLAPHPLRYLRGQAQDTATRWKAFLALLRQHVTTPDDIAGACLGAQAAFDGLRQELMMRSEGKQ